ncbi:MAG TPA: hypothetical protein VG935_02355, partial [Patescibacteria group bacterium]|nr:hypothetical protein [Patescibacteria group bacterium]
MKKVIAIFFVCLFFVLSLFLVREFRQRIDRFIALTPDQTTFKEPSPTPTSPEAKQIDQTLFVPYWSLTSSSPLPAYQTLIYFSVLATNQGIDTTESGYTHLEQFANLSAGQQKLLTVSMQNSSTNFVILKDQASQKKVIDQSIALAKKYGFKGILLNIEVSALPFSSLIEQITDFNKSYATAVHRAGLSYSITAYGDTFYRLRPFDM